MNGLRITLLIPRCTKKEPPGRQPPEEGALPLKVNLCVESAKAPAAEAVKVGSKSIEHHFHEDIYC